jgi:hypothetical protein
MKNPKECKWFTVCPMNYYYKKAKIDKSWIDNFCFGNWNECIRYQKEESGIYHPDNMMPDGTINPQL